MALASCSVSMQRLEHFRLLSLTQIVALPFYGINYDLTTVTEYPCLSSQIYFTIHSWDNRDIWNFRVLSSLPADVLWGSFVTHSFLPHVGETRSAGRLGSFSIHLHTILTRGHVIIPTRTSILPCLSYEVPSDRRHHREINIFRFSSV